MIGYPVLGPEIIRRKRAHTFIMLAILGVFLDDESSCGSSSDDPEDTPIHSRLQVPETGSKSDPDDTASRVPTSTSFQQFSSPGVRADNIADKPVNLRHATGEKTALQLKFDQLQKFQNLQAKRVQAAEEKVPEGYKRRRRRKRRHQHQGGKDDDSGCPGKKKQTDLHSSDLPTSPLRSSEPGTSKQAQERWETLKEYIDVNSHISQGIDHGHLAKDKSGLEKRLDEAIAEGDFEMAEKLSEDLSTRDFGCRIAKAADARDYMKWKLEKDEEKAAKKRKKKKKLPWGFEVKNRWEMKANM